MKKCLSNATSKERRRYKEDMNSLEGESEADEMKKDEESVAGNDGECKKEEPEEEVAAEGVESNQGTNDDESKGAKRKVKPNKRRRARKRNEKIADVSANEEKVEEEPTPSTSKGVAEETIPGNATACSRNKRNSHSRARNAPCPSCSLPSPNPLIPRDMTQKEFLWYFNLVTTEGLNAMINARNHRSTVRVVYYGEDDSDEDKKDSKGRRNKGGRGKRK